MTGFYQRPWFAVALVLCAFAGTSLWYIRAIRAREGVSLRIAAADRSLMDLCGFTKYRFEVTYSSAHRFKTIAAIAHFIKRHTSQGLPGTRTERRLFGSGTNTATITLHYRRDTLYKAEIEATPPCTSAAREWARHVGSSVRESQIFINGTQVQ